MGRLWQHGGVTLSSAAVWAHCSLAQGLPGLLFVRWFWRMAEVQGSGVESRGREGSESGSSGHTTGEQRVNLCCTTASSSQQLLSREKDTLSWLEGQRVLPLLAESSQPGLHAPAQLFSFQSKAVWGRGRGPASPAPVLPCCLHLSPLLDPSPSPSGQQPGIASLWPWWLSEATGMLREYPSLSFSEKLIQIFLDSGNY